jgi:hypothetical protein
MDKLAEKRGVEDGQAAAQSTSAVPPAAAGYDEELTVDADGVVLD